MSIPCVHNIRKFRRSLPVFVYHYSQDIDSAVINILVKHVQGQGIVHVVSDIRFQYNLYPVIILLHRRAA